MKKRITLFSVVLMLALAGAVPAFAADASGGAGREFGSHHAKHAQDMNGFDGEMNPGVMHSGFSGWGGM